MIYVVSIFGGFYIFLSLAMLYVFYREQHFGTFLMAITYGLSGLLAISLPHWWPLVVGFVMVWLLRLMGMEQRVDAAAPPRSESLDTKDTKHTEDTKQNNN